MPLDHHPESAVRLHPELTHAIRELTLALQRLATQVEHELTAAQGEPPPRPSPGPTAPRRPLPGQAGSPSANDQELQRLRTEVAQLRGSLAARAVIEQAKGMLMAGRRCTDQQAFDLLVAMSQSEQRKVREIAADLVAAAVHGSSGLRIDLDQPVRDQPVRDQPLRTGRWPAPSSP